MKVLLVNDASGVHANLKQGLIELGHSAKLAQPIPDYQSRGKFDIELITSGESRVSRLKNIVSAYLKVRAMEEFDIVNYVNTLTAFRNGVTRYADLKLLKNSGARLSYYGVGCDEAGLLRVRSDAGELACTSCIKHDSLGKGCASTTLSYRPRASEYSALFDFSVSAAYIYSHCHDFFPSARHANIPFPIVLSSLPFNPARNCAKPMLVHSPTRRGFKGSDVVLKSISILESRRADFEFRLIEGLSYDDYISTMKDCDIYIDQVYSGDAQGIAALENMAAGKVVISGNGKKAWKAFPDLKDSPVIRASSSPEELADVLCDLLDRKRLFPEIAEAGRSFVAKSHDHISIAGQFVGLWRQ
jgi:glycosyltransferase involved in cell wall biosynthesis